MGDKEANNCRETYVRTQVVGAHRGDELAQEVVQLAALDVAVACRARVYVRVGE